ncbi:hypothetical protein MPSEU_000454700 [Mayamaea pseudoterrestris]|nr:hypothetical protein MPSEU_000454700 [Mayamaea pseudoterrestris]
MSKMSEQQQQRFVASMLHDELECVSITGLARKLEVSQSQASRMLEETATKAGNRNYQAHYVTREKEMLKNDHDDDVPCTVFRLTEEPYSKTNDSGSSSKFLYSLAMMTKDGAQQEQHCESLSAAHEREMAHFRDLVTDNHLSTILSETARFDLIQPSPLVRAAYDESIRIGSSSGEHAMDVEATTVSAAPIATRGGPKKTTTAASFFSAKAAASNKKKEAESKPATTKTASNHPPVASAKSEEKENSVSKARGSSKVGIVDDNFVGDEESDDEEMDHKHQSHAEYESDDDSQPLDTKAAAKTSKKQHLTIDDSSDDEPAAVKETTKKSRTKRKDEPVASGAMDAFATKKDAASNGGTAHKRRRKKLVEKTTMDASGYLHTETQEIWEDIPSDEEEVKVAPVVAKKAAPKPVASKKNAASMKQGSLMGFFKKK